ncbi:MAG: hypothetical protein M1834_001326 [Cirrosporium novae-zelandiae]|nr:MAG: hypothetical protein M1834_001326 [Cirrosporium novae-zelandiae]
MAPKNQHHKGKGAAKSNQEEVEEPLQAVVLADTYETRFSPFTLGKPRCLLPLANTPLIEYTLEFLANSGVKEVFLYPGAHPDQVEEYINNSKWRKPWSPFRKFSFLKSAATSVGEVMRDLDGKGLMNGHFLVVSGDIVCNLPIEDALTIHRARHEADKNAIMTIILREAGVSHLQNSQGACPLFVIDPTNDRCLHYDEMHSKQSEDISIDPQLFKSHPELDLRPDLLDCRIDICTPDALSLWSDNFDYQSPRQQFLKGVLKDYELNGKTIHTYIVNDHYAARVKNLQAYVAVSKDIISRRAYPFCPDTNLLPGHSYSLGRRNNYQEGGVVLARSCEIKRNTVIGRGTSIGDGSIIENSVLGRRCQIGKNVILDGAYIWDDAVIGDGSEIRQAIVANEAFVGPRCKLEPGALVTFAVRLAEDTTVLAGKRIAIDEEGHGYDYNESDEDDEDDLESVASSRLMYNMANLSLSDSSVSTLHSEPSEESESRAGSTTTADEGPGEERFLADVSASVLDALEKKQAWDVIHLDVMSSRLTFDASDHSVRHAIIMAFNKRIQQLMETDSLGAGEAVKKVYSGYKMLIERAVSDADKEEKPDEVDFLILVQQDLIHYNKGGAILLFTAQELYNQEIFEEEAFHQWWEDPKSSADEDMQKVRTQTEEFIKWLKEAESESESESEGGSDEDDEYSCRFSSIRDQHAAASTSPKTPPLRKKRKALDEIYSSKIEKLSIRKVSKKTKFDDEVAPATPLTDPSTPKQMDSEDEYLTDASSMDGFDGTQDSDDGSFGEDFGDEDIGFQDKDILQSRKKPYEVDFKVCNPDDILKQQKKQIDEVSAILGQPPEATAILLRYTRWNREKLIESYMDRQDHVLEEAGLGPTFSVAPETVVIPGFECDICFADDADLETYAMKCGHRFCVGCYRQYLMGKIKDEGEAARIQCPGEDCRLIVDSKSLNLLCPPDLRERYQTLLTRTYVDDKDSLKWCPAPNCEFAVECEIKKRELDRIVPTVNCNCGHSFCFGCTLNDHQPAPCSLVRQWLKKCEDDSETANWISANTKECPKCSSTIEKNGGCNHMTCRKCKHEFCWMCMGIWSEHGTSWYNCNRYEEKSGAEARDAQARSRQSLERYLHYYNRYANHEHSAKLDKDIYLKTERKMTGLQSASGMSWIEVQFLSSASQALQQCRQTLKWTYAFAYYLKKSDKNSLTEVFEDNQKDLELAVEDLSEMFEKPVAELSGLKVSILDKTAYCNKRRVIVLSDTAEILKKGDWRFSIDVSS